ncbi:aminoacyl-histidine dipeptidase [Sediminitomix flava]|uniref:Cytosol non-specific dipeptidase n=1 Tax=Sediminitomix flava TaxID=379075 RepID=A0A315ZBU4_SEDFL|nr:aminoacyl-histidine dipeptidase [Sediminitomix flava]PWJ42258.1 dipeptidase D [Sediminitomix flava]
MNQEVINLAPSNVWECFEQLNAVPRPSKKEERVIEFTKKFGEDLGLETIVDKIGNVIIRKPATAGMEDRTPVVLQAHLDMVHQKNAATNFDFNSQGIESYIDGGWVKANGTTLGADNGMGVAAMMAVLKAKDIEHGPVECLFTIDEETGMTGAKNLEPNMLQAKILLNLDTEDEGELCIGCAGGIDNTINLNYTEEAVSGGKVAYKVTVKGLKGGHSGCDIHLGRGNANKIMNEILLDAASLEVSVSEIDGGSLRNAIPRESFSVVVLDEERATEFEALVAEKATEINVAFAEAEGAIVIQAEKTVLPSNVMNAEEQSSFLDAVEACPNGVLGMSPDFEGLVETSTSMARIILKEGKATVQMLTRSSVDEAKDTASEQIEGAFANTSATFERAGEYAGWAPNPNSAVLETMQGLYTELFGKAPVVNAVHAGLECGIIGQHYPEMDMISFGPTIKNPHSPDEMCEIESVQKFWDYLVATLKNIK